MRVDELTKSAESAMDDLEEKTHVVIKQIDSSWRGPITFFSLLMVPMSMLFLAVIWIWIAPGIWDWGFEPLSLYAIPAVLILFFLLIFTIVIPSSAWDFAKDILNQLGKEESKKIDKDVERMDKSTRELYRALRKAKSLHLLPVIKFSKDQMKIYYRMGMKQATRSYNNSNRAMWIGFLIILVGVGQFFFPLEVLGLKSADFHISVLILASGAVVETISALFLWVYQRSIAQMRYFFDREMHTHNILMCFRVAESMDNDTHKKDVAKMLIIRKVLEKSWEMDMTPPPGAKGFRKLAVSAAG